ncbi:VOC family protein [Gloeocapsa sp. PCC 73106]|uniref:SMU1112c/YaeR family gloxylase I-like metalloprotein n=1 Tax=Gloeocapsa sp. PCC 73106 TaxID=102232 RepID=UPI0002ACB082|nr:VOC family protein [Gloeocapsa sp. PCC 73106]ELR97710.1 lactoylglutathione lyase-like lyase [Gloeocapsa sp. PCC 73106]
MKIDKIHHIAIICSDYEKSRHFYVNLLGFSIIQETYRELRDSYKLDLLVGNGDMIELFSFPSPPSRASNPESCGLRHLAFQVKNIEETVDYLESKGISVEAVRLDELTGKLFTFFKDPDNLPMEIYQS